MIPHSDTVKEYITWWRRGNSLLRNGHSANVLWRVQSVQLLRQTRNNWSTPAYCMSHRATSGSDISIVMNPSINNAACIAHGVFAVAIYGNECQKVYSSWLILDRNRPDKEEETLTKSHSVFRMRNVQWRNFTKWFLRFLRNVGI
jgi:hypothetical protein